MPKHLLATNQNAPGSPGRFFVLVGVKGFEPSSDGILSLGSDRHGLMPVPRSPVELHVQYLY